MRARPVATGAAILLCMVPAACADDPEGKDPRASAIEVVQVAEPQAGAALASNMSAVAQANASVAVDRKPEEVVAAEQEARATVAKMGQPDQPAGW